MAKTTVYFGKPAEDGIKEYLKCKDDEEKKIIYLTKIEKSFSKLVENIINMPKFNFISLGDFRSLQDEVMAHLYSNLHKFNPRRLSKMTRKRVKAFSYFGTMAKNYLVQQSIRKSKIEYLTNYQNSEHEDFQSKNSNNIQFAVEPEIEGQIEQQELFGLLIRKFETKITDSSNKSKIADAIVYFLKNSQMENIYSKKHLYLLLRELTGLETKNITEILKEFKEDYRKIKNEYYEL